MKCCQMHGVALLLCSRHNTVCTGRYQVTIELDKMHAWGIIMVLLSQMMTEKTC
jgi:hypothetical protein